MKRLSFAIAPLLTAFLCFSGTAFAQQVTVNLTSPSSGTIPPSSNLTLSATATAPSGYAVTKVEFFRGTTLIATDTASPYSVVWSNVPQGNYAITAKATATKKNQPTLTGTSSAANIVVTVPPSVSLSSPSNNSTFGAPATITLAVSASDNDGAIAKVEYYIQDESFNWVLLGSATQAPYSFVWANVQPNRQVESGLVIPYLWKARAYDNQGATTETVSRELTVTDTNNLPTVAITTPTNNSKVAEPATINVSASASDSDGTVARVDFYQGATLIGTAYNSPFSITWANVQHGSYTLTAKATDNVGGQTTSSAVTVLVDALPSVNVTSPAQNASFNAPANIPLQAQATDVDGSISSVAFYYGNTLIATLTSPPYSVTWTDVPQGSYSLTARATDNFGFTTSSSPINITVNTAVVQVYFIEVDHLNTPRLVTDAAGAAVWKWDQQEPFGINVPDENPSGIGTFDLPLRLPGQYFDKETNLAYNYFRDFDPGIGRYVKSDPLGLRGGLNTYAYAYSSPLRRIDPSGLITWSGDVFTAAVAIGAVDIYTLKSECACGYEYVVRVKAYSGGLGRGATLTGSSVELKDTESCPDPEVLVGDYFRVSAGFAGGVGIGFNYILMGRAGSPGGFGVEYGYDISVGASFGQSYLDWAIRVPCTSCGKK